MLICGPTEAVQSPPADKDQAPTALGANESGGLSDSEDAMPDQYCASCVRRSGSPDSATRFLRLPSPEEINSGRHQARNPQVLRNWSILADAPGLAPMSERHKHPVAARQHTGIPRCLQRTKRS